MALVVSPLGSVPVAWSDPVPRALGCLSRSKIAMSSTVMALAGGVRPIEAIDYFSGGPSDCR